MGWGCEGPTAWRPRPPTPVSFAILGEGTQLGGTPDDVSHDVRDPLEACPDLRGPRELAGGSSSDGVNGGLLVKSLPPSLEERPVWPGLRDLAGPQFPHLLCGVGGVGPALGSSLPTLG